MLKIEIDGKKYDVSDGLTLLQAAELVGIEIPHLCYHEQLSPSAACRLCVVEVEGAKTLVASCAHPVSDGLKVKTDTERVRKARKLAVELLISDCPQDCMTCEQAGNCKLQDYAYEFGIKKTRFEGDRHEKHNYPIDSSNPFIERDFNKCVLCGRCVSVCDEIQVSEVLDFSQRGFNTKIATGFDEPLGDSPCVFCGQCVWVCPTGSLIEKPAKGKGRTWEMKKIRTTCTYCGCGCTIHLNVKDDKIVKVTSVEDSPVAHGALCVKGRFGYDFVHSPERLTSPLVKRNGKFEEVSWDEANSYVSNKLTEIKEKYGPDSIGVLSSAKCTNEENYLMQKFARAILGTNNVDHCARLCHASTVAGLVRAFGSGAMTNSISEIDGADAILVTGSNTTEAHPVIGSAIKRAVKFNGTKVGDKPSTLLIVVDPRGIELAQRADIHIRQPCGSDVAWINGMMNVIISEGLHDVEFIEERTEGFEELKKTVAKYTPDYVEEITEIPADDLRSAAIAYASAEKAMIFYSMGITQHTTGTDNVLSIANLAMLTGNVGKESTGVNPLRGQSNVQGACDLGALPNVYPGYQSVTDLKLRKKFEKAWGVDLPAEAGLTVVEMMNAAYDGHIKGMYIMGENPTLSDPDISHVKEGLKKLDFLVVQDIFLTETAKFADVVLPAASCAEKDGTITNTDRRVQRVRKAVPPPGSSRADWKIICELAGYMGYEMVYSSPAEIMDEIASLTPIYGGIHYDRLEIEELAWPCTDREHSGTKFLHKGEFTRGLGKFHAVDYIPPYEETDEEYPFVLTTGRVLYHFHTGEMTRRVSGLNEVYPSALVEINPSDASELDIDADELVKVSSRRGSVVAKAEVTERTSKGTVFMTFHFKEAAANLMTGRFLDPIAKIPEYKVSAVKIEKG